MRFGAPDPGMPDAALERSDTGGIASIEGGVWHRGRVSKPCSCFSTLPKPSKRPTQGFTDKTPVVSLVSRETGEVRSRVVPTVNGENLRAVLDEQVDAPATHLHTDYGPHYHKIVGDYFSQLKRSLDGTHHKVSREHLDRYLAEFDFRHSTPQGQRYRAHSDAGAADWRAPPRRRLIRGRAERPQAVRPQPAHGGALHPSRPAAPPLNFIAPVAHGFAVDESLGLSAHTSPTVLLTRSI